MAEFDMATPTGLTLRILWALTTTKECSMEELVEKCAPYTWNAVFFEVDRLLRAGQIRLLNREKGVYALSLTCAA